MPSSEVEAIEQYPITLPHWGLSAVVVRQGERVYFPLNVLCAVLGLNPQRQRERIREHEVLSRMLRQFATPTAGGRQLVWHLDMRGVGFWLGSIQLAGVRAQLRPKLIEFQEALVDAAARIFYGEVDTLPGVVRYAQMLEDRIGRLEERVFVQPDEERSDC